MSKPNRAEEIRQIAERFGLSESETDSLIAYDIEQNMIADEIISSAAQEGLHLSIAQDDEVFINLRWINAILAALVAVIEAGAEVDPLTVKLFETLSNSVTAAKRYAQDYS